MNPIDEIQYRLKGKNLSQVSRNAGMAYKTVFNLAHGKVNDIYISTYQRLSVVLDKLDKKEEV